MDKKIKIMIIEDDKIISSKLKKALEKWNYSICEVSDFSNILEEFESEKPHLILLDILLPYYNGYHWCTKIRNKSNVPIIFISSKSNDMDIIMAMQFGGDDFITKPINIEILVAKISALLRRSYDFIKLNDELEYKGVKLKLSETKIIYKNKDIELTKTELMIADALFKEKGSVVSRSNLMEKCWKGDDFIDDNTLAVNITRLRKKLKEIGLENFIQTKKKIGYFLKKEM
ncbi:MAG: DNA-binding response regulator [Clostridiales bacterium]|nr:MAG: DNA-binding response regulator [Clostridiales bacterium]